MSEDTPEEEALEPSSRPVGRPFAGSPDEVRTKRIVGRLVPRNLIEQVREHARANHVTLIELLGRARTQHVCVARDALYLAFRRQGWSWVEIGKLLEVNHSTVIQGSRRAEERERGGSVGFGCKRS